MFDFDAGKLIVIGIVALIAIPSKDLPRVLRQLGQMSGKLRRMAADFQSQFVDAMREAELHDLKKEVEAVRESVRIDGAFDPMAEARKQIANAVEGPPKPAAPEAKPEPSAKPEQHTPPLPVDRGSGI